MDYIIVSTSECSYQHWQLKLLKWSAKKVKQKGKIIFLVSHDHNHFLQNVKIDFPDVEVIILPDWAKEWEEKNKDWWGGIPNKYESISWLCKNKSFKPSDRLLFLDPDMIFTSPIDLYPLHGEVIGQKWEGFSPLPEYPSKLEESIMYPFAITFLTLSKVINNYKRFCISLRKLTGKWESEMWGLHYALEYNNVKFTPIKDLGRCTVWNPDNSNNISKIIHYPNIILSKESENIFFKQDYTFTLDQEIKINKSRNLTDRILLSNVDQERTDYIYEAKWDFPYLFKSYNGENGYLYFQPWSGGFNNIRMSFEQAICLSYLTNRTLVLPEAYSMYLTEGDSDFSSYFETDNLGINHISFKELCDLKNINADLNELKNISKVLKYDSVANVINFEKVPVPKKFLKHRKVINSEDIFDNSDILFFDRNLLGAFDQSFYTKHETSLKQLVGKYVVYRNDLRDIAWQFINLLKDKSYYSLHIRRNDFQYKELFIPGDIILKNIKEIIPEGSTLYIATDSRDPKLISPLRDKYNVILYNDLRNQLDIKEINSNWVPIIEQLICSRAIKFVGNENSTLSSYVYKIRNFMEDIDDKNYYINTSPINDYTNSFIKDKDFRSNWAREYQDVSQFNQDIIFVSIASYLDNQIFDTLKSLYDEVSNPNRVKVVVHLQDTETQYHKLLEKEYPNLKIIFTPYKDTQGVVWARNRIKDELVNESYFLQIDSHSRFKKNWDLILINQYNSIEEPKVILSTYPNHFDVPDPDKKYLELEFNTPLRVKSFLDDSNDIDNRLRAENLSSLKDYQIEDTKWVAAGFLFTTGEWVKEVKVPEQMVFSGEEDSQTHLSYLNGWNIKIASEATIWHNYEYRTTENLPYRTHNNEYHLDDNSIEEINNLLFNKSYPRKVSDLEKYLNINFKNPLGNVEEDTIFIAIASYLDYELPYTILDCIQKSDHPENLFFGVCLQYDQNPKTGNNIIDYLAKLFNIQVVKFPYTQSEGGCWARQKAQQFYNNEKYSLQIDSHTRLIQGWDTIIKKDYLSLSKAGIKKPLLSFLPPSYTRDDEKGIDLDFTHLNELDRLNIPKFKSITSDYWLEYVGYDDEKNIGFIPHPMKILYGGFVFTEGNWVKEIEQDPEHYYTGEELALTIRSFTHGYSLYTPSQIVAWHRAHPKPNKKHFNNNPQEISDAKHRHAMQRLRKLIHKEDLGKYSLGNIRTLEEYEQYAGLDFINKKVL